MLFHVGTLTVIFSMVIWLQGFKIMPHIGEISLPNGPMLSKNFLFTSINTYQQWTLCTLFPRKVVNSATLKVKHKGNVLLDDKVVKWCILPLLIITAP